MKNIIILITLILTYQACTDSNGNTGLDEKKKQLKEYRTQIDDLKSKIGNLEKEIALLDTQSAMMENLKRVSTLLIEPTTFEHYIELRGVVQSKANVLVTPEISGAIQSVKVVAGDRVSNGQTIAQLDAEVIRKNVKELETNFELAKTVYERQSKLWEQKIGSEIQHLQAKSNYEGLANRLASAKSQLAMATIQSPIDGVVDEVFQNMGETALPGQPIARVVNLNQVDIVADVPETYLNAIKRGDVVKLNFPSVNLDKEATITAIGQYINPNNRTFKITITIKNTDNILKPNLLATVLIKDFEKKKAIKIPTKYMLASQEGNYVYLIDEKDNASIVRRVSVKTGENYKGETNVLEGLNPGDQLITAGFNTVVNGQEVVVLNE